MKDKICIAFNETNRGFSADRVIADPILNREFIERCKLLGIVAPPIEINLSLLNLRKAGLFKGKPRSIRTSFPGEEAYRHASEIAARYMEKRHSTTLDRVICDPELAIQFDAVANDIAPGFSSLQYRWAALNLRKSKLLRPELLSQVVRPVSVSLGAIENLRVDDLPAQQGLYIFYSCAATLYVGEASNLRRRVARHLDHSDNKNLARWFWSNGFKDVRIEFQVLNEDIATKVRRALEAELIARRHPLFNVQRLLIDH